MKMTEGRVNRLENRPKLKLFNLNNKCKKGRRSSVT